VQGRLPKGKMGLVIFTMMHFSNP